MKMGKSLLSIGADAKTVKGEKLGYKTGILYLAPVGESLVMNTCPNASAGCAAACLFTAGRGSMKNVKNPRIEKTRRFKSDPSQFVEYLAKDIEREAKKASRGGFQFCVRLNGTSDLPWENIKGGDGKSLMERFPETRFYDYTKSVERMRRALNGDMPGNYSLTFSRSEENENDAIDIAGAGGNVAVVFSGDLPRKWRGNRVIDGDKSDLRFLDPAPRIVGLKAKGKARKDTSGFVVQL